MLQCVMKTPSQAPRRPPFSKDSSTLRKTARHRSVIIARMKTATRTLLALSLAAAFGAFAATGMGLLFDHPAEATTAAASAPLRPPTTAYCQARRPWSDI